jgi:hypothetical protein
MERREETKHRERRRDTYSQAEVEGRRERTCMSWASRLASAMSTSLVPGDTALFMAPFVEVFIGFGHFTGGGLEIVVG